LAAWRGNNKIYGRIPKVLAVTGILQFSDARLDAKYGELKGSRLPEHIGIIPDGNRRWAVDRGLEKRSGYDHGIDPAFDLYERCRTLGVKEVSIYGFTRENTKRPREQREAYQAACVKAVRRLSDMDADLLIVGDSTSALFPDEFQSFTTRRRIGQGGIKVNLLINYSWRWDLDRLKETGSIGSSDVSEIELVIRWGGRSRLSGFLPVPCAYADLYVLEDLWPDYSPQHLVKALEWYQSQDITKGG
jgi:undecaprenyl diphosphate synthase